MHHEKPQSLRMAIATSHSSLLHADEHVAVLERIDLGRNEDPEFTVKVVVVIRLAGRPGSNQQQVTDRIRRSFKRHDLDI
jgi:hypothetical protein